MVKTMNAIRWAGALALAVFLAACGEKQNATPDAAKVAGVPTSNAVAEVYSAAGTVKSIAGNKVTIAHGPIEGIGWPAMTMSFTAPPGMADGVQQGAQVGFSFRQDGGSYVLTSLRQP